jgi:NAD(P)-dependent dehydrogenase (short-subunit alcohol dehydrogenase family)
MQAQMRGVPFEDHWEARRAGVPAQRFGRPEEFAKLVAAIVDNPMLNGQCLRLDAGQRFAPK